VSLSRLAPRTQVAALAAAGAVVVVLALSGTAGAAVVPTFDATASAYGFDATTTNQAVPLGLTIEGAGPVAQAELSSLPAATSFASLPYPGPTLVQAPGLVGAVVPGTPELPDYPAYVGANLDQGPQSRDYPGASLDAQATATQSQATAVGGTHGSGFSAFAQVRLDRSDDVIAEADATFNDVALGQLMTISNIHSAASETFDNGEGKLTPKSDLTIGHIAAPGLELTIPKSTPGEIPGAGSVPSLPVPLGGTTLAAPDLGFENGTFTIVLPLFGGAKYAVPFSVVAQGLKALGIEATYQQPIVKKQSIVAAGLTFSAAPVIPTVQNVPVSGAVPTHLTFGRSSASFAGTVLIGQEPGLLPGSFDGTPSGTGDAPAAVPPVTASTGLPPVAPVGDSSTAPALATGAPPASQSQGFLVAHGFALPDMANVYLLIVGAAVLGSLAAQGLRVLGVRIRWSS
jgi:hypothetical protein